MHDDGTVCGDRDGAAVAEGRACCASLSRTLRAHGALVSRHCSRTRMACGEQGAATADEQRMMECGQRTEDSRDSGGCVRVCARRRCVESTNCRCCAARRPCVSLLLLLPSKACGRVLERVTSADGCRGRAMVDRVRDDEAIGNVPSPPPLPASRHEHETPAASGTRPSSRGRGRGSRTVAAHRIGGDCSLTVALSPVINIVCSLISRHWPLSPMAQVCTEFQQSGMFIEKRRGRTNGAERANGPTPTIHP